MCKKLFLTLDYELFFGQSGTVEKTLLKPTYLLLDKLEKNNQRATFFVDATYLLRLSNLNYEKALVDYEAIKKQLREIIRRGNRIELHLHPHWLDAIYIQESNTWDFSDLSHYRLSSLQNEEIENLFKKGKELLEYIIHEVDSGYKIIAFRAGGWCVQPFDKLVTAFKRNGLLMDSSVSPGLSFSSHTHCVDYKSFDLSVSCYQFDDNVLNPCENGDFLEVPISSYRLNLYQFALHRLFLKILPKRKTRVMGDGIGVATNKVVHPVRKILKIFSGDHIEMFTLDGYQINSFIISNIESYPCKNIIFISHPKLLTLNSLKFLDLAFEKKWTLSTLSELLYEKV